MSLDKLGNHGDLERIAVSKDEIKDLLIKAARRLEEANNRSNYPDTRLEMTYNSVLYCATTALRAVGYRVTRREGHHWITIDTLRFTIGTGSSDVEFFQNLRSTRNAAIYDRLVDIPDSDLNEVIRNAEGLFINLNEWLQKEHPDLIID